jgi:hypothetical protein
MKRFVKLAALCIAITLLAATVFCIPAQAMESRTLVGNGSVGEGVGKQTTLVDFTASDLSGFDAVGNTAAPTFANSNRWNANVLYTWMDSSNAETGICGTIAKTSLLQNASTLSVHLLAQYKKTEAYTATLRLESLDKTGAPLVMEAATAVSPASWQTVTFEISSFLELANPDAPCKITLLTSSNNESEQFVLWVHSIYTSTPETQPEFLIPVIAAAGGFLFGFAFFFVIYRATCKKNRHSRRQEAR